MITRIDTYPTGELGGYRVGPGHPLLFGVTPISADGINFSIFSQHATACTLVLFAGEGREPVAELAFPEAFRTGNVWSMVVFGLDPERFSYGYRFEGPWAPRRGHRFDARMVVLDPYAPALEGRARWGEGLGAPLEARAPLKSQLVRQDFDWGGTRPPGHAIEDLVVYELHVRGFTRHPSAGVRHPGTFAGLREKIPYLKALGVNAVELMPIFEFDELDNPRINPATGEALVNYWGYNTLGFFAPKAGYAATGALGMQVDEFKALVKMLHDADIEVILDVVFNHTGEGDERGPTLSFRGIDNRTYYMLSDDGEYLNFSGTGNTLNCNHPVVRTLVLDCLRYWVVEFQIDGFRFDLASILGRDQRGVPLQNPPLLELLAHDPVLARCKLIAEAWDAGGLYQVGRFPGYDRFAEWNGPFRDTLRRFLRGEPGLGKQVAQAVMGSPHLYGERGPQASINFITCHDGFTLRDLFSYERKHNLANGEQNRDGEHDNHSWSCGVEGETTDAAVRALRLRMMRNAVALLMVSHGVPMLLMGDELGRTQGGNNNAYCHDAAFNWLDWSLIEDAEGAVMLRFVRLCVAFRRAHPVLRGASTLTQRDRVGSGWPDISWHGVNPWAPDWSPGARTFAFMLDGRHAREGSTLDDHIYVAANMHWDAHAFRPPQLSPDERWLRFMDTGQAAPEDIHEPGREPALSGAGLVLAPRSVVILVGRPVTRLRPSVNEKASG